MFLNIAGIGMGVFAIANWVLRSRQDGLVNREKDINSNKKTP